MPSVRSCSASKIVQFRPKRLFGSQIGSYVGYHLALHVEPCNPCRLFEIGISRCALNVSNGGHTVRLSDRENTRTDILPASRCYCAAFISKDGTHTLSIEHRNSCDSRKYKLLYCPSATGKAIQRSLTGRAAHNRANSPWLPAGYLAGDGSGSLQFHATTTRDDFRHSLETSPETSVTITPSHVVMYMPCGAVMVPWPQIYC